MPACGAGNLNLSGPLPDVAPDSPLQVMTLYNNNYLTRVAAPRRSATPRQLVKPGPVRQRPDRRAGVHALRLESSLGDLLSAQVGSCRAKLCVMAQACKF